MAQGVELATGYVSLTVSARGIAQEIQRELGGPIDRASKAAGDSIEDGIGGGASRAAQAAKLAISSIGSAAVLSGMKRAVDAASDLEEAANVTQITFGEAAGTIDDFASTAATRLGQSERAAREAAAGFGGLLQNLDFTAEEAAETSIELTTLASDLASAFNTDPAEAVQALGSALRGESEPIRRYNVLLSEQVLQQAAVEQGLVDQLGPLDAQTRAQAALGEILQQTSRYQGDFANTSDSAANAQRIAAAQAEETAASFGDAILPIYTRLVETAGDVAEVFANLPEPVQTGILALAGVTAVAGPVSNLLGLYRSLRPATQAASVAVNAASTAVQNSASSFDDLYTKGTRGSTALRGMAAAGGALAAVGLAATLYEIASAGAQVAVDLEGAAGATTEELQQVAEGIRTISGDDAVLEFFRQLAEGTEGTAQAAVDLRDAYAEAGQDVSGFDSILQDAADSQAIAAERTTEGEDALNEFTSATGPAADAQQDFGDEINATAGELFDWEEALDEGLQRLRDFYDLQTSVSDVQAEFRETLRELADFGAGETQARADALEAVADAQDRVNAATTDEERQAALEELSEAQGRLATATLEGQERLDEFRSSIQAGRDDILDTAEALFEQGKTTDEVIPILQGMADELFNVATEAGLAGDEALFLRGEFGLLPEQIDLNIRTNVSDVRADIEALLAIFTSRTADLIARGASLEFISGGSFAEGGVVPGALGEPVFIKAHAGEIVLNAAQQANVAAAVTLAPPSSGGDTINIHGIDRDDLAREVRVQQRIKDRVQAGGW